MMVIRLELSAYFANCAISLAWIFVSIAGEGREDIGKHIVHYQEVEYRVFLGNGATKECRLLLFSRVGLPLLAMPEPLSEFEAVSTYTNS
jgi:hypothetical protein